VNPKMKPSWPIFLDKVHPEDRPRVEQQAKMESTEKNWEVSDLEYRIALSDSTIKHIHAISYRVTDGSGETSEVTGTVMDVTERKRAEEKLRAAYHDLQAREAKIRRLVNTDVIGIVHWTVDGKIVDANDAFLQMVGYSREDLVSGRVWWTDLTPPEWREQDERFTVELKRTGFLHPYEKEYFAKNGVRVPVMISTSMFEGNSNDGVAYIVDLTERKRAERERERLRQLEADLAHINRVSMMGELAASLAHEIKQPITAATTYAKTCLRWLQRDPPEIAEARETAVRMVKDVNHAADIINRVRSLFTKDTQERESVDVNELIEDMIVLLRNEANRYSIPIRSDLAANLPRTTADRVQLQQVLMNLMLNAIEAMKDTGGELTIRSGQTEERQLLISVTDTGVGLPAEKIDQIFDAFFTTKPQGTGMGLAITRSIIEAHGGRLWATANGGCGATFRFTLPREVTASSSAAD
jgi:PAS domain S-box-containing protein